MPLIPLFIYFKGIVNKKVIYVKISQDVQSPTQVLRII